MWTGDLWEVGARICSQGLLVPRSSPFLCKLLQKAASSVLPSTVAELLGATLTCRSMAFGGSIVWTQSVTWENLGCETYSSTNRAR